MPKKSPYKTIQDIIEACGKGTKIRVAIQPGGVSEIGYSGLKNAIKLKYPGKEANLVAVNTGSQSAKDQLLFDGQADLINGSVQGNEQYTRLPADDQKAMRFIWLTARHQTIAQANPEGMGGTTREQLLQFVEPDAKVPFDAKSYFTFDKEFFFLYNKEMDPKVVAYLDKALAEIFAAGNIREGPEEILLHPRLQAFRRGAGVPEGESGEDQENPRRHQVADRRSTLRRQAQGRTVSFRDKAAGFLRGRFG